MKTTQKAISLILAMLLILSLATGSVFAAETGKASQKTEKVMTGYDDDDYDDDDDYYDDDDDGNGNIKTVKSGNYEYKELEDGTVAIIRYYGLEDKVILPSKLDGKKVTVIGDGKKDIFTTVTVIDDEYGFSYNKDNNTLEEAVIPDGVTSIEKNAFSGSYLDKVTLPDSLKSIGDDAFSRCVGLKSISIPDSVTVIGSAAFWGCTNLSDVEIGKNVLKIYNQAFDLCDNLKSITLPDSLIFIGEYAMGYADGEGFNKVKIEGFNISGYAGSYAEAYAKKNEFKFTALADNGQGSDADATPAGEFEYEANENGSLTITKYIGASANVIIPNKLNHNSVTEIGKDAFKGLSFLKTVTFKDSIKTIGDSAFCDCTALKTVKFNDKIEAIGDYAFSDCTALETADLPEPSPDSCIELGKWAFYGCTSLKKIYVPDNVIVGAFVFCNCSSAESIYIGKDFKIDWDQFQNCTSVKSVKVSPNNEKLADLGCNGIFQIKNIWGDACKDLVFGFNCTTLPEDIQTIGNGAFFGMTGLTSVKIPYGCKRIMRLAYTNCTNLKSIEIPVTVTDIGEYAIGYIEGNGYKKIDGVVIKGYKHSFAEQYSNENGFMFEAIGELDPEDYYTYSVDDADSAYGGATISDCCYTDNGDLTIPETLGGAKVTTLGKNFSESQAYHTVTIPKGVKQIKARAFNFNQKLYKVDLPDGLESIENSAFYGCSSLKAVRIPESVTTIGSRAFYECGGDDDDDSFTIYGKSGSAAEKYAKENEFTFMDDSAYVEPTQPVYTDPDDEDEDPVTEDPTNPAVENPTNPADNTPTDPGSDEPTSPAVDNPTDKTPGDVNGDGDVDMKDVTRLQKYINKWNVEIREQNSDVNGDGDITMKDIILLQKYINKWDVVLK